MCKSSGLLQRGSVIVCGESSRCCIRVPLTRSGELWVYILSKSHVELEVDFHIKEYYKVLKNCFDIEYVY